MSSLIYQCFRLSCGILYPTYSSFKAVRSKNVREYVRWMMYWIVFALFSFLEAFADIIISWLPFYYELKICLILWLMLPATRGASVVYRKLVHPQLLKKETEIDGYIEKAKDQSYAALIALGARGFTFATNIVLNTAAKGHSKLTDTLQKSLSLTDLSSDIRASTLSLASDDDGAGQEVDGRPGHESYQREVLQLQDQPRSSSRRLDLHQQRGVGDEMGSAGLTDDTRRPAQMSKKFDTVKNLSLPLSPTGGLPSSGARESKVPRSPSGSSVSSGFGDELSDAGSLLVSPISSPISSPAVSDAGTSSLFARWFPSSGSTTTVSWRSRSSYSRNLKE